MPQCTYEFLLHIFPHPPQKFLPISPSPSSNPTSNKNLSLPRYNTLEQPTPTQLLRTPCEYLRCPIRNLSSHPSLSQVSEFESNIQQEPVTITRTLIIRIGCHLDRHRLKLTDSQPGQNIFLANIFAAPSETSPLISPSPRPESESNGNLSPLPMLYS